MQLQFGILNTVYPGGERGPTTLVVVVAGGCGGIGSAFVLRFVNDGAAAVAVLDLNTSRANKLIEAVAAMTTTTETEIKSKVKLYI